MYETHGTECHFVHKRLIGAVGGFLTGGPLGAISGFASGGGGGGGGEGGCRGGMVRDPRTGGCVRAGGTNIGLSGRGGGVGSEVVRRRR